MDKRTIITKCKYCRKDLVGPCSNAHTATICGNAPEGVGYRDLPHTISDVSPYQYYQGWMVDED